MRKYEDVFAGKKHRVAAEQAAVKIEHRSRFVAVAVELFGKSTDQPGVVSWNIRQIRHKRTEYRADPVAIFFEAAVDRLGIIRTHPGIAKDLSCLINSCSGRPVTDETVQFCGSC